MRQRLPSWLATMLVGMTLAVAAEAQVVIKLGTIAPEGSVWGDALQRIAQAWKETSGAEGRASHLRGRRARRRG